MSYRRTEHVRPEPGSGDEIRCDCGSLMARRRGALIELKCRRCKLVTTLSPEEIESGWTTVELSRAP